MTNFNQEYDDLYGSKYLSAGDLHGEQRRREIGKVDLVELKGQDGTTKRKYVAYLKGEEKALVLNKTNATKLGMAFGKDRSKWVGASVELYGEMTSLGKEGVRLRVLTTAAKPAAADMNDEIPAFDK
jgi:hypothetical protein